MSYMVMNAAEVCFEVDITAVVACSTWIVMLSYMHITQ